MKNCPKCGVELADDVTFCTECGEKLIEVEAAPEAEVVAETPVEAPKSKVSLILGIVSLVLTFVPIIGFVYPITAIVGLVFGVKETKAGGKKVGLILNIVALVIFALSILAGIVLGVLVVLLPMLGMGAMGGMDLFDIFEELLWELGLI